MIEVEQNWPTTTNEQQNYPLDLIASLRQHSLFQRTNNEEFLSKLASSMHVRIYSPRDIIIAKGEVSKAMFFLLRGQVEVCSADFERIYATLPQGSCFGEIGILYSMPRTATVVASTKCTVAALTADQVHTLLPQFPDVEKIIRFEAEERLCIMSKSDQQQKSETSSPSSSSSSSSTTSTTGWLGDTEKVNTVEPSGIAGTGGNTTRQRRSSVQYNVESFSKTGIRSHLEKIPFFFGCSIDFLHLICLSIQPRNHGPNTIIFNQGEQGDEMYFIVDGYLDVELDEKQLNRLGPGDYFGDTSVLLNIPRATTVKTVTDVELYVLNRMNLQRVCDMFPDTGSHLKTTTESRLHDLYQDNLSELPGARSPHEMETIQPQSICRTTCDQDPTLPITPATELRNKETKKRRASVAVWSDPMLVDLAKRTTSKPLDDDEMELPNEIELPPVWAVPHTPPEEMDMDTLKKMPGDRFTSLNPSILVHIMSFLDFGTLIQVIRVNQAMRSMFKNDQLVQSIDLSLAHKKVTDDTFAYLMPMVRRRLRSLCLAQCFHLTDVGFRSLWMEKEDSPLFSPAPLQYLHTLDLNSCWLLTDKSLQLLGEKCPQLTRLDLSNCRKITNGGMYLFLEAKRVNHSKGLEWLSLSYCKNLNDVTMQHLAEYTNTTLTYLNIQRCTKITDQGFVAWTSNPVFIKLQHLLLMDCSFLTDRTIQLICQAAPLLTRLSLSFCCSLSDSAMIPLSHMTNLADLDMSFCGAAVSDHSLKLLLSMTPSLKCLNLRGCVRVTGDGLLALLDHRQLHELNISQCPCVSIQSGKKLAALVHHLSI
ncbi:uncharacterized protein BX664DRAFT_336658 [Halteromyces radiatus]|uniref:uncharacterized protein n=1 Tax=Halteromyces radiatus TaxID=101107 RepID=UPI0022207AF1|nr:uncharacterized protein BX664DRAFT_336658 [Halteromyces radiatus]KAI8086746.1 hypothetical protein BX664DRAFT_336658 [Halteromyces radiatus]